MMILSFMMYRLVVGDFVIFALMTDLVVNGLVMFNLMVDFMVDGFVMSGFVMNWFVVNSLMVHWLNLNVSDLGLVMSVLGNLNVALVSSFMGVSWFVMGLLHVVRLLNVVVRLVLVGRVFRLHVVVSIVLFCDS